jgi:hypothetical protein
VVYKSNLFLIRMCLLDLNSARFLIKKQLF